MDDFQARALRQPTIPPHRQDPTERRTHQEYSRLRTGPAQRGAASAGIASQYADTTHRTRTSLPVRSLQAKDEEPAVLETTTSPRGRHMTARLRLHQEVAVVEVGSASGCPSAIAAPARRLRRHEASRFAPSRARPGSQAGGSYHDDGHSYRVVPVCCSCGEPITGTPVYAHDDPLHREWCSEECRDASAEESYEQHDRPEAAT